MKYIKLYESVNNEVINKLINWNIIDDIKDMSLEYLDDGYILNLDVRCVVNREKSIKFDRAKKKKIRQLIYQLTYSHSKNIEYIPEIMNDKSYTSQLLQGDIIYVIRLGRWTYLEGCWTGSQETIELRKRVKNAYPNERIYY